MPRISTIIPVYNRPLAAARAVASALAQSRVPDEILLVDDASLVPLTYEDLGTNDPRVRICRLEQNLGAAGARQAGIDAATGELLAFLDSDDVWLPEKLASQLPLISTEMIAVSCGWNSVPERGGQARPRIPLASTDPLDFAAGCWFCPGSTVLIAKSAFTRVGPLNSELRRLEDLDWFLRFALSGGGLRVAPMLGAVVSTGRRGRRAPVEAAARQIRANIMTLGHPEVTPALLGRLDAYLDLERAAGARNDGDYLAMALLMLRSLMGAPRLTIPLRRWWPTGA